MTSHPLPPAGPPPADPPRSRRGLWVLALVVALPIAEIALLIAIGRWIGVLATIGVVLLVGVVGVVLLVVEGPRALRNLREAVSPPTTTTGGATVRQAPHLPTRELSDGAVIVLGALLLVLPGFISDVVAVICLLPFTRPLVRRGLGAGVRRRAERTAQRWRGRSQGPVIGQVVLSSHDDEPPHPGRGAAVEGEIIEPGPEDRP